MGDGGRRRRGRGGRVGVAFLRRRPFRVAIEGASMLADPPAGRLGPRRAGCRTKRGDVVVVEHPGRPGYEMVKRLTALPGDRVDERVLGARRVLGGGRPPSELHRQPQFGPVPWTS